PREGERGVRPHAVVDVEERRLEVGLDAVRLEQPADTVDGRVLRLRRTRTAGDTVEVAEVADELRKRDRRRGAALDRGRVPQVAARRLDLRERVERVDVAREDVERRLQVRGRNRVAATRELELAELRLRPRRRLRLVDRRVPREQERAARRVEAAEQ